MTVFHAISVNENWQKVEGFTENSVSLAYLASNKLKLNIFIHTWPFTVLKKTNLKFIPLPREDADGRFFYNMISCQHTAQCHKPEDWNLFWQFKFLVNLAAN